MKAVFTRLTKLLGQPPEGIGFCQFVAELGCEPIIDPPAYSIPTLGVTFTVFDQLFKCVLIHFDTPSTRQGTMSRYQADLPNDIDQDDAPETIEKKLSVRPVHCERPSITGVSPKYFQDTYALPPLVLVFEFATDIGKLSSIAVGRL
jgi:hypothetical protein